MNSMAFYVRRKAKHCSSGETSFSSFGPFPTYEEALAKQREDEEARGEPEFEYYYRIVGHIQGNAIENGFYPWVPQFLESR